MEGIDQRIGYYKILCPLALLLLPFQLQSTHLHSSFLFLMLHFHLDVIIQLETIMYIIFIFKLKIQLIKQTAVVQQDEETIANLLNPISIAYIWEWERRSQT